jgi:hypothetical protein
MARRHLRTGPTTVAMLFVWGICAFGLWSIFLR